VIPIRDANPRHAVPWVSWVIVAVNAAVYAVQSSLGETRAAYELIFDYAFIPARFEAEPGVALHTLVTSAFMHGSWMHLLSNMIFLIVFADNVEDRMGRWRFAIFYLMGAAAATGAHGLLSAGSPVPLVGASGAVSAVLGAYILMFPHQRVQTFIPPLIVPWIVASLFGRFPRFYLLWLPAWLFIGYWVVIQLFEAGSSLGVQVEGGGVAWWAHIGGFAFGAVLHRLFLGARGRGQLAGSIRP
jgi:membrane associated rhomboid family serine protease